VSEPSGREQLVEVRTGDDLLRVIAPADFGGEIGESVGVRFDRERLHLFDAESGSRI
jgi:ABC-type sugar transport system ATPase subunit